MHPRVHPNIPPIEELRVATAYQPLLNAIRTGDKAAFDAAKGGTIATKQLGTITSLDLLALYGPWKLVEPYTTSLPEHYVDLGKLLGTKNWKGYSCPSALLSLFNPHPQVTAEIFASNNGELATQRGIESFTKTGPHYTATIWAALTSLYCGKYTTKTEVLPHMNDHAIGVIQYLCTKQSDHDDCYSRLLANYLGVHREYVSWTRVPLHNDPRLIPLYPQIRDNLTPALKRVWPERIIGHLDRAFVEQNHREDAGVIQAHRWLKDLAQEYIRYKAASHKLEGPQK